MKYVEREYFREREFEKRMKKKLGDRRKVFFTLTMRRMRDPSVHIESEREPSVYTEQHVEEA